MQEKKVSKVGWLPVEEKISDTFSIIGIGAEDLIFTSKSEAGYCSKTGEARKVKVTLSLTVEDV